MTASINDLERHIQAVQCGCNKTAPVFGLHLCSPGFEEIAELVLHTPRDPSAGVGVIATANIQHIATMRHNTEFREAMQAADVVTCDGFPVFRYAASRGCELHSRTTGREIVDEIMRLPFAVYQRLYFVVDGEETAKAIKVWASERDLEDRICVEVPPMGFIHDDAYCRALANRTSVFGTTLLFLCTGAPQSEIYTYRYRSLLPACWALCVGQSVRIVLGLNPPVPAIIEKLNVEWLWRIFLEPRRLLSRYTSSIIGFAAAIVDDLIPPTVSTK